MTTIRIEPETFKDRATYEQFLKQVRDAQERGRAAYLTTEGEIIAVLLPPTFED